jgi:hypothetical protein
VYWEYEIAEVKQKVAIECKNYKRTVSIGKVRDFYGVLSDLKNVIGIMVTKVGYQEGAKKYADTYGINLKELKTSNEEDGRGGDIEIHTEINIRRCLFWVDEDWAKANKMDLQSYKKLLDSMSFSPKNEWEKSDYLPLETTTYAKILDKNGQPITLFEELENKLPQKAEHICNFEGAYVDIRYFGRVKIKGIKYVHIEKKDTKIFALDARDLIKAILKDALSGEIKLFDKNGNVEKRHKFPESLFYPPYLYYKCRYNNKNKLFYS